MNERNDSNSSATDLRMLTLAYVQSRQSGTGPTLEDLVEAYPEYASELIDFATHYYITEEAPHDDVRPVILERADLLLERQILDETFAKASYPPALTNLVGRAHQRGYDIAALAAELDLGEDVIISLNERVVEPSSIKEPILEALGRALATSIPQLWACLSQPPVAATANYAKQPPVVGQQQTLGEVIRKSQDMEPEQKAMWLARLGEPAEDDQVNSQHRTLRRTTIRRQR